MTVQSILRHADVGTTLDIYTHAINRDKLVAQSGQVAVCARYPPKIHGGTGTLRSRNLL